MNVKILNEFLKVIYAAECNSNTYLAVVFTLK